MNRLLMTMLCFVVLIFSAAVCFSKARELPVSATIATDQTAAPCIPETVSDDMQNSVVAGLSG
jgi:hypothetical protein